MARVTATDADDPMFGNNAKLIYSILQGEPYFSVEPKTGQISVFSLSSPRLTVNRVHTGGWPADSARSSPGLQTLRCRAEVTRQTSHTASAGSLGSRLLTFQKQGMQINLARQRATFGNQLWVLAESRARVDFKSLNCVFLKFPQCSTKEKNKAQN